jgi:glycosyltransferase involved in cell wall biosynthesis
MAYVGARNPGKRWHNRIREVVQSFLHYCRVFKLLREKDYDLVQVKDHYVPAIISLLACKLRRKPFVYWLAYPHAEGSLYKSREGITRHKWYYLARGHFWKLVLYKIILPSADHVFVQSEQMKQDLAVEGVPLDRMTAVPGSIDLQRIPYDSPSKNVRETEDMGDQGIVYLGTLSRVRHLDFLLRAFARVSKVHSDSQLYMLGKGDELDDIDFLKAEAARLRIEKNVIFTGHLPMDLAWEYIRKAAVCVSPYYPSMILNSTSPTKLVEYMAMGRPTVGNDHPEQKLVIEQSGAGICVKYDEAAFADAIVALLNQPEAAVRMGLKGRKFVEDYRTNAVMADIVEHQYRRILDRDTENRFSG